MGQYGGLIPFSNLDHTTIQASSDISNRFVRYIRPITTDALLRHYNTAWHGDISHYFSLSSVHVHES